MRDAHKNCNIYNLNNFQIQGTAVHYENPAIVVDNINQSPSYDPDSCSCTVVNQTTKTLADPGFKMSFDLDEELESNKESSISDDSEDGEESTGNEEDFDQFLEDIDLGDHMDIRNGLLFWCFEYNIRNKAYILFV